MSEQYDALALFSGGLDSILAVKLVERQGLSVLGLHFVSPFFGCAQSLGGWRKLYGIQAQVLDLSEEFADLLAERPAHGFGKLLNPCIDCKILMMRKTRELMAAYGAKCLISGEVLGQRPMSQRRDALDIISRDAGVREVLIRPLCAKKFQPTSAEQAGALDHNALLNIGGRGRKDQLALAAEMGLQEIPPAAGGCKLTEPETAKRYLPFIDRMKRPAPEDYQICDFGRHYWAGPRLAAIGRRKADNEMLAGFVRFGDASLKLVRHPGPLGLLRRLDGPVEDHDVLEAAALTASFSPKARREGGSVGVSIRLRGVQTEIEVVPNRNPPLGWREPKVEDVKAWKEKNLASDKGKPQSS
jgi:hypothetical protein